MCRPSSAIARLVLVLLPAGACEARHGGQFTVIPGPSVPSPLPIAAPYVWDTRDELDVWVHNAVTRGPTPISVVGDGIDAFIRIEPTRSVGKWILRGPDLTVPARPVRQLKISYRWLPDPDMSPGLSKTFSFSVSYEALNPPFPPEQPRSFALLQPAAERADALIGPGSFRDPLEVRYLYFHQPSSNAGIFELHRIELLP